MKNFYLSVLLVISTIVSSSGQNIVYTLLYDNSSFNGSLVKTLAVGSIAGQKGVSGNRVATYSIPIAMPSGTNSVVPSVSM